MRAHTRRQQQEWWWEEVKIGGLFTRRGLKIKLLPEKTEVMHIGHQREELDIELEGKKLTQGHSFVYPGGAVCGEGKTEREVRRRVQAGANTSRAVEEVMADRRISKRLKGKVMSTCVTPACLYGMETLALTELQQQRLQVCGNNWVRKIARVTRADRRRMVELREETGVQRSLTERLVRSSGHSLTKALATRAQRRHEQQWLTSSGNGRGRCWKPPSMLSPAVFRSLPSTPLHRVRGAPTGLDHPTALGLKV